MPNSWFPVQNREEGNLKIPQSSLLLRESFVQILMPVIKKFRGEAVFSSCL